MGLFNRAETWGQNSETIRGRAAGRAAMMDQAAQVLALAQQTADMAIADANREAERILADARREAEEIRARARAEVQARLR